MPQSVAAVARASMVDRACRRPSRRGGSSTVRKKPGRDRIWSAVRFILGAPCCSVGSRTGARSRPGRRATGGIRTRAWAARVRGSPPPRGRIPGSARPRSSWRRGRRRPGNGRGRNVSTSSRPWPKRSVQSRARRRVHSDSTREPRFFGAPGRIRKRELLPQASIPSNTNCPSSNPLPDAN